MQNKHIFLTLSTVVRLNTLEGYKSAYRRHIRPTFGDVDMDDITVLDVQSWINSFNKPGCARRAYTTLRQIIRYAADVGEYSGNDPTKHNIHLPSTPGNRHKVLTSEEVKQLVRGFRGHELEACVLCSVSMGLRRCECFGLKWNDIDFSTGAVTVQRSRQYIKGTEVVYPTKTKKSTRTCYLPKFALARLKEIQGDATDWLLPLPVSRAAYVYKKHVLDNNLPYTPFMNLRHTWATLAVESGTDVLVVAQMLGHTDASMAYSRYVKPSDRVHRQVQSKFNLLINTNAHRKPVTCVLKDIVSCVRRVLRCTLFNGRILQRPC